MFRPSVNFTIDRNSLITLICSLTLKNACVSRSKMVQDSAHIRQRGAQDFMAYYDFACSRQESVPLPAVKMNLDKGMLDFNGDRVKLTDWPPLLNAICINKHLHHIAISSTYQASLFSGDIGKWEKN